MTNYNAESEAQRVRGTEIGGVESQVDTYGKGGFAASRSESGHLGEPFSGASGARADRGLIGGIVSRMIADKRERLREVDECLDWYEREKVKRTAELADLEQLASQLESASEEV